MANNTSTFTLRLRTQGMDQAQQQSQTIRDNLQQAQQAAQNVSGSGSSRRFASSAAARPTGNAGASAGVFTGQEVENYNRARGASGAAGGTARDFADQARGLGGLVRLYATVAANTFALTAAFGALSRAMDTTNMVKGLDQLGAASGVALGSLSKRLVAATDGAISLREAMEATTKAVSSGMNSQDVLRLGNVAKQASQALGVDMGDAISRLTRGITKLEPELLDELGIFTKLDPAVKEYAKSVNKSVSELTDFERRAAFANAVLAEGEQKFSSIKIDANPYTKLSASIRDASQNILEFVNKVVAPVANFFSQSPTALLTGIGALAAILVKQALPAIGEFRQGLEQTAQRAGQLAQQKAQEAQQARQLINQRIIDEVESRADRELRAVEAAEARIQQLQQGNLNRRSAAFRLLSRDLQDITEQDLQRVERAAGAMERRGRSAEASAYRDVVTAIRSQITAETDLIATRQRLTEQVERDAQSWGTYGLSVRAGQRAQDAAIRSSIISNAAYNGSLIGLRGSFALLREEIARNNITGFSAAMLTARGAIAAFGGMISTAMNALNGFFMVIGLVAASVSLIDGIFSKASKEIDAFSGSVGRVEGSTKNLTNTFDTIRQTNPFSVQSMEAQSNALLEFSSSMDELAKNAQKALRALQDSGWDKFKNTIKGIFNLDVQSSFSESFGQGIVAAVEGIDNKKIADELKSKLGGLLNIEDVTNFKQVEKALKGLAPISGIVEEIRRAIKGASNDAGIAASRAREFVSAFEASKEAFRQVSKEFEVSDSTVKWANTSIAALTALDKNLSGPISESISNLIKASDELNKSPIFGSSSIEVAKLNIELNKAQKLMVQSEQDAQNLEQKLKDLQKLAEKDLFAAAGSIDSTTARDRPGVEKEIVNKEIARLKSEIDRARNARAQAESTAEGAALKIRNSINTGLSESVGLIAGRIQAELAKGSTQLLQSLYSRIDNIPELAGRQFDLKIKELDGQERLIRIQQELANRITLLTAETALSNALESNKSAREQLGSAKTLREAETAGQRVATTDKDVQNAEEKLKLLRRAAINPLAALADLNKALVSNAEGASGYAQEIVNAAQSNAGFIKSLQDIAQQQELIKKIEKPLAEEDSRYKKEKDILDAKIRENSATRESLQLQLPSNKETEIETLEKLRIAQIEQASLEFEDKKLKAKSDYNKQLVIRNGLVALGSAQDAEMVYQNAESNRLQAEQLATREEFNRRSQIETNIAKERLSVYDRQQSKLKEIADSERQNEQTRKNATLSIKESELGLAETRLSIAEQQKIFSEEFIANSRAQIELTKQELSFEKERQNLTNQRSTAIGELAAKANRQAMRGEDNSATIKQMMDLASAFDAQALAQDRANSSRVTAIQLTRSQAIETAKQNEELKKQAEILGLFEGIADTLAQAFGKTGAVLGNLVKTFGDISAGQEKYNTDKAKYVGILADIKKAEEGTGDLTDDQIQKRTKATKDLGDLERKKAKDEISDNARLMGSAKTLFKEKTAAYKILSGVEKALHIARIAMDFKELATSLFVDKAKVAGSVAGETAQTAATGAGFFARAGLYVTEIFAKISAQLGIFGPPVAAAIVAAIGLSVFGKKSSAPVAGSTASERQETQGTGMTWKDGKKVETGGGVFGDSEAKSDSIKNSLNLIGNTSVEGLTYQNRTVKLLESIDRSIGGAAKSLYGVLGLRMGTGFGTKEGTTSSGIQGLFGSRTTKEIIDSGIKFAGSFLDVLSGKAGSVQQYETTRTTKKSSGFLGIGGSTRTTDATLERDLASVDQKAAAEITKIFSNAGALFVELGGNLGKTQDDIFASLAQVDLTGKFASLRGLQGEELQKELGNVISSALDDAATIAFKSLEKFRNFGEGMAETVVRVLDTNEKISQSFLAQGGKTINQLVKESFGTITETVRTWYGSTRTVTRAATDAELKEKSIEITEALATLAGGLDKFLDNQKFYADNFLTEAERLTPVQASVTKRLGDLAIEHGKTDLALIKTRGEFKNIVNALDITTPAGRELYTSLMELAPAFAMVYKEAEKITELSKEDFVAKINQTRLKSLQMFAQITGSEVDARKVVLEQRKQELAELDKYPAAQKAVLKSNQEYLYALEDQLSAQNKLIKRRDLLKSLFNDFGKAIDNLTNYKNTLLAGDLSTLLPIDKYNLAKTQFEELLTSININPETEAQAKAQLEAISKLPQVSDAFLQASRMVNASSGAYASDFQAVTAALDASKGKLQEVQEDIQVHQLDELKKAGISLEDIADSSRSTADLIKDFNTAQTDTKIAFDRIVQNTTPQTGEVKAALQQLAIEFKEFKDAMMGKDGIPSIKTALVGEGTPSNTNNATQILRTALTGEELTSLASKVTTAVNKVTTATLAQTGAVVTATLTAAGKIVGAVDDMTAETDFGQESVQIITLYQQEQS
jgi:hypothetical protein